MGGEGSISQMISTLRNNKNLLKGRKGFFRRELTYSELRNYYRDSKVSLHKEKLDKEHLEKIRNQIQKDRRKTRNLQILATVIVIMFMLSAFWIISNLSFSSDKPIQSSHYQKLNENYNESNHYEMFLLGLENMKNGKYFFAVGNFESALQKKPDDLEIKIVYLESLCLLCSTNNQFCVKAKKYLIQISNEHPNNKEIKSLIERYLK